MSRSLPPPPPPRLKTGVFHNRPPAAASASPQPGAPRPEGPARPLPPGRAHLAQPLPQRLLRELHGGGGGAGRGGAASQQPLRGAPALSLRALPCFRAAASAFGGSLLRGNRKKTQQNKHNPYFFYFPSNGSASPRSHTRFSTLPRQVNGKSARQRAISTCQGIHQPASQAAASKKG